MTSDVVLDANVLVAYYDDHDSLHEQASELIERLQHDGHGLVLLDVCVNEALSALCRRFEERTAKRAAGRRAKPPPDLDAILDRVLDRYAGGDIRWVAAESERLHTTVLDIVRTSRGALNYNDALLVALHREGTIEALASFDADFESLDGIELVR